MRTVPPDKVTDRAIALSKDYPNKKLIIHYLQRHYPFLGKVGKEFHEKHGYTSQSDNWNIWTKLRAGEHDEAEVWEAYKENLRVTLPEVECLINNIQGKIVITSDHGNAFGEHGVYGHPRYVHIPALTDVPWFILPYENRRKIKSSETTETFEGAADDDVKEKLRDLDYVE